MHGASAGFELRQTGTIDAPDLPHRRQPDQGRGPAVPVLLPQTAWLLVRLLSKTSPPVTPCLQRLSVGTGDGGG